MFIEVEHVYKIMRYKIIRFKDDFYIVDMDQSLWFLLFPFVFWFIPHTVYKIDKDTYKLIQIPKNEQMSVGSMALLGGGISFLFFNLLKPVLYALNIPVAWGTKIFLFIILIIVSIFLRLYIHRRLFENLNKIVNLENLHTIKLKINPGKPRYYLIYSLAFLFAWGLVLASSAFFLAEGNVIAIIAVLSFTLLALIWHAQVIPIGTAKVTIIDE